MKISLAAWFPLLPFVFGTVTQAMGQFLYVADYNPSGILNAYTVNPSTGALTSVPGSPFSAGSFPRSVTVGPSGQFAYATNAGSDNVSAYVINQSTGALAPVPGSPFSAGSEPVDVAVDPTGKFAYVVNFISGNVSAYSINANTGALTQITGSPFPAGPFPESVVVHPSGKFVYVTVSFNGQMPGAVLAYAVNSTTGALTSIAPTVAAGGYPIPVTVDPAGNFAYVGNTTGGVSGYTINSASGSLAAMPGSPFASGPYSASLAVDPKGRFLYSTDFASTTISAYNINSGTGVLTPISGSPFSVGPAPRSIKVDPRGEFAYVAISNNGIGFGTVATFAINSITGALTAAGSPVFAGNFPISVAIAACLVRPTIGNLTATPSTLWPPNGQIVNVAIGYSVTSSCGGGIPICTLSVISSEKSTSAEWIVIGPHQVELRAARDGLGTGRVYTISVTCQDTLGNSSSQMIAVQVPHDLR